MELATGVKTEAQHVAVGVSVQIGSYSDQLSFVEVPLKGCDAILGDDLVSQVQSATDWKNGTMSFYHDGNTHRLDTQSALISLPSTLPSTIHTPRPTAQLCSIQQIKKNHTSQ